MKRALACATVLAILACGSPARAESATVTYQSLAPDAALDLAKAALKTCREHGYQVAVVVLDRFGQTLVLLRDRYAGLPAATTANDKAYTALSFHLSSDEFAKAVQSGKLSA